MNRKERETLRRRDELLSAAAKLFAHKGYFRTTMAEIAAKAEFALGTIYQFFRNKEDVYFSIISEKSDELIAILKKSGVSSLPPKEAVEEAVKIVLDFFHKNIDFFRIYITGWGTFEWTLDAKYTGVLKGKYERFIEIFEKIIERGIQQKIFKPFDPKETAYVLVGILSAFIFQWSVKPGGAPFTENADMIVDLFTKGASV
jgi:AcrR family transcriptional regulator